MSNLSNKIKSAREESKLSQIQVGSIIGISDKTVSGYESGRICPPIDKLQALSDLYKKPITYFLEVDSKDYKVSSRLRGIEMKLNEIRDELKEIKVAAQNL